MYTDPLLIVPSAIISNRPGLWDTINSKSCSDDCLCFKQSDSTVLSTSSISSFSPSCKVSAKECSSSNKSHEYVYRLLLR